MLHLEIIILKYIGLNLLLLHKEHNVDYLHLLINYHYHLIYSPFEMIHHFCLENSTDHYSSHHYSSHHYLHTIILHTIILHTIILHTIYKFFYFFIFLQTKRRNIISVCKILQTISKFLQTKNSTDHLQIFTDKKTKHRFCF
jgi:hypothetical protein